MFENMEVYQKAVDFADQIAALTEKHWERTEIAARTTLMKRETRPLSRSKPHPLPPTSRFGRIPAMKYRSARRIPPSRVLQWTGPGRLLVFALSATSIWCLLSEMYGLCDMRTFFYAILMPATAAIYGLALLTRQGRPEAVPRGHARHTEQPAIALEGRLVRAPHPESRGHEVRQEKRRHKRPGVGVDFQHRQADGCPRALRAAHPGSPAAPATTTDLVLISNSPISWILERLVPAYEAGDRRPSRACYPTGSLIDRPPRRASAPALPALPGPLSRFHGQQNPRFWPPRADSLNKKFYWRTVTPSSVDSDPATRRSRAFRLSLKELRLPRAGEAFQYAQTGDWIGKTPLVTGRPCPSERSQ